MKTEREHVAAGANLLDRILPGWHNEVNLDKLRMSSSTMCLLGQTFGLHQEKSLAKEMYPEEWADSLEHVQQSWPDFIEMERHGFVMAVSTTSKNGSAISRIMRKLGIANDPERQTELAALTQVCAGHDNKCEWAEEIAARRANDTNEGGTNEGS